MFFPYVICLKRCSNRWGSVSLVAFCAVSVTNRTMFRTSVKSWQDSGRALCSWHCIRMNSDCTSMHMFMSNQSASETLSINALSWSTTNFSVVSFWSIVEAIAAATSLEPFRINAAVTEVHDSENKAGSCTECCKISKFWSSLPERVDAISSPSQLG